MYIILYIKKKPFVDKLDFGYYNKTLKIIYIYKDKLIFGSVFENESTMKQPLMVTACLPAKLLASWLEAKKKKTLAGTGVPQ